MSLIDFSIGPDLEQGEERLVLLTVPHEVTTFDAKHRIGMQQHSHVLVLQSWAELVCPFLSLSSHSSHSCSSSSSDRNLSLFLRLPSLRFLPCESFCCRLAWASTSPTPCSSSTLPSSTCSRSWTNCCSCSCPSPTCCYSSSICSIHDARLDTIFANALLLRRSCLVAASSGGLLRVLAKGAVTCFCRQSFASN